jgi:hypothetical protein
MSLFVLQYTNILYLLFPRLSTLANDGEKRYFHVRHQFIRRLQR